MFMKSYLQSKANLILVRSHTYKGNILQLNIFQDTLFFLTEVEILYQDSESEGNEKTWETIVSKTEFNPSRDKLCDMLYAPT